MSNSGVHSGMAKCFIVFMVLLILLQGGVYFGLALWGIDMRDCSEEPLVVNEQPIHFAFDMIYFLNKECGLPQVQFSSINETLAIEVNWGESDRVANRTYILEICYAAISGLWVVTSLLVLVTICSRVTKVVKGLCYWPWFLSVLAGCVLDAVATGFHVYDITQTTTAEKFFSYLHLDPPKIVMDNLGAFQEYLITPAVIMSCISSRIILIWILNVFGAIFCFSLSNVLSKRNTSTKSSISAATTATAPVTAPQPQQMPRQEQLQVEEITQQQIMSESLKAREPPLIKPKPLIIQNVTTVQRQSSIPPQSNNYNRAYDLQSPTAPSPNASSPSSEVVTYRHADIHPDRINYPAQPAQQPGRLSQPPSRTHESLSPVSPLNTRYSTSADNPLAQQRISEELRGQLPWSYTTVAPSLPKKPQMQVYPEIPEPDYGH